MQAYLINLARKEQTRLEAQQLRSDLQSWLDVRRMKDVQRQYHTQLQRIETLIGSALSALQPDLDGLDLTCEPGVFYDACHTIDLRIVWLRRVWHFFKEKFDQRDDPLMGPLLRAADEVVWSCYHQIFVADESLTQGPAPLPFIEPDFSPAAFPAELVPGNLKDSLIGADFLRTYLNQLPIPVVRLPPSCVRAPWWLVYVGHEIGHHIQHDLELVVWFRERVTETIEDLTASVQDAKHWGNWSQEIFADVFSVLVMGPWAITAMIELELANPAAMSRRRPRYPSPLVRLKLLVKTAEHLGMEANAQAEAYGLDLDALIEANSETSRDAGCLASILEIALGPLLGLQDTLLDLVMFNPNEFEEEGPVEVWSTVLIKGQQHAIVKNLRSARLMTSATLRAWSEIVLPSDEQKINQIDQLDALAARALDVIARSREEGTRETIPAGKEPKLEQLGTELARLLRETERLQLEAEDA